MSAYAARGSATHGALNGQPFGLRTYARRGVLRVALAGSLAAVLSCGSPTGPGPITPPPPPPNQPPVITAVQVEPARIELNETVTARATVQDAETPVSSLRYEWSADGGSFAGEGASVTWSPPRDAATPADFPLRLTVRETYASAGGQAEHRVSAASAPVRVHDSPTELRDMSLRFLDCFADSRRTADQCLVDFSDSCSGKESERRDIEDNRKYYDIRSSSLRFNSVNISESRLSARATVSCEFRSVFIQCPPGVPGCVIGGPERVRGECVLTATYEARRWWLCSSTFRGELLPLMRRFFGSE